MTNHAFSATVRTQQENAIIDLSGEINALVEQDLNEAFTVAEVSQPQMIVLNFSAVEYINSTGIALIVGLLARARKNHIPLAVFGLTDHYREIFDITRLSDFMNIYQDEASALAT